MAPRDGRWGVPEVLCKHAGIVLAGLALNGDSALLSILRSMPA